jgi:hypothetical protein
MKLEAITLRAVRLPLVRPYVLSYRTFTEFEPIIVEARDGDGRIAGAKAISRPSEQRNRRWASARVCRRRCRKDGRQAKEMIAASPPARLRRPPGDRNRDAEDQHPLCGLTAK